MFQVYLNRLLSGKLVVLKLWEYFGYIGVAQDKGENYQLRQMRIAQLQVISLHLSPKGMLLCSQLLFQLKEAVERSLMSWFTLLINAV